MGLMMLITSRGMRDRQASRDEPSIDDLRAERRRVAAKIERLGVEGDAPDRARGVGASS
jgi:hypothetical protein